MSKKHKWSEVIHAFAEGKEIQWRWIVGCVDRPWFDFCQVSYAQFDNSAIEWRVKPHKYQALICQFLIDAHTNHKTIQFKSSDGEWVDIPRSAMEIIIAGDYYQGLNTEIERYRIKPHKYQDAIDAYVRGETVQYYVKTGWNTGWMDCPKGRNVDMFDADFEFRIKPKPDVTKTGRIYLDDANQLCWNEYNYPDNVKFTFDGETGKLKEVKSLYE